MLFMKNRRKIAGLLLGLGLVGCDVEHSRVNYKHGEEQAYVNNSNGEGLEEVASEDAEIVEEQPDYRTRDFSNDSDEVLLARMIFGEARGRDCLDSERIAIGYVALNRIEEGRYGRGLRGVLLRRNQFHCFNENNDNGVKVMNPMAYEPAAFEHCLEIARGVLSGIYTNETQGATHYFNPRVASPSWADSMTRIGRIHGSKHVFYKED